MLVKFASMQQVVALSFFFSLFFLVCVLSFFFPPLRAESEKEAMEKTGYPEEVSLDSAPTSKTIASLMWIQWNPNKGLVADGVVGDPLSVWCCCRWLDDGSLPQVSR